MREESVISYLLIILLLGCMGGANAEIYKWVDAQGNTHYGERPPADSDAESVTVRKGPSTPDPLLERHRNRQQKFLEVLQQEREEKEEQEKKNTQEREQRLHRCHRARDKLRSYRHAGGIYNIDKKGKRVYLDQEEREKAITRVEEDVRRYCK
jgi:hypothetical protein